jgi:ArsR family metal-binding transcriptional regulator
MQNSITTINTLADILDEIIKEVNENDNKSGDSSAPQKKVSLDLGHCIMCYK